MPMETSSRPNDASSVLYQSHDKAVVVLDIPRSLEEAQCHNPQSRDPAKRLYSVEPVALPFNTPEPRDGGGAHLAQSQAYQLADLMTTAAVQAALEHLGARFAGPYCHSRVIAREDEAAETTSTAPPAAELAYFEPEGSAHLHGSIQDKRQTFIDAAPQFQLVVLDPPWPNRSARRSRKYSTAANAADVRELLSLIPIPHKLAPNGLVAIWITNASSVHHLVTSPTGLLASWGLDIIGEWTWVKVTASGEPVYDVDSQWRKPWERLLIAKRIGSRISNVPPQKMIFAVPDLHSRKPNLRGLFQDVLGDNFTGLEVFARNLTAGWWSWGNEVMMFQEKKHWLTAG